MKIQINVILVLFLTTVLVSCSQEGATVEQQQFEAYLKLKRIPMNDEARTARQLSEYQRRQALANAIEETEFLDQVLVDAELEEFRKELLISRYFESYLKDAVTDNGIQTFYRDNEADYRSRKIKVSHILFRVNPRMNEQERQAVLTTASEAHGKLMSGQVFEDVAKATSEDKVSAEKGGDLGWINEGAISKAFSDKVFAMKAGGLSEPFLTDYGFHIVTVTEGAQDVIKPLESLKGDIRYQLRNKSKKAEIKRLLDSVNFKEEG